MNEILEDFQEDRVLCHEEAVDLLQIPNASPDFYRLLQLADGLSRREYGNQAYVFSQIGLNAEPCSMNCKFCSMAKDNFVCKERFTLTYKDREAITERVGRLVHAGTNDVFLMTTADYPFSEYLEIGRAVSAVLPRQIRLVANIGDFSSVQARQLRQAGFTGAYHIRRLREGIDTDITPERRQETIENIQAAGLELYYCIEPIGPEHSYDEIADEMIRARRLGVRAMAVMRRTPVPGTPLAAKGKISSLELTKIAAVTRLVSRPERSMNVHEVTPMSLLAGVNQLYAEEGANPRDASVYTEKSRGYSVAQVRELLLDAEYELAEMNEDDNERD